MPLSANPIPAPSERTAHPSNILARLDKGVNDALDRIDGSEFWKTLSDPALDPGAFRAIFREVCLEIWSYQPTLIEAMMCAVGRYPKTDPKLMKSLALHVGDEADHGHMALQDYLRLGGDPAAAAAVRPSPASFAVMSCWWGLARLADPHAYLGAMYLFEALTPLVCQKALTLLESRGLRATSVEFIQFHATEDIKHSNLMRHLVEEVVARYPGAEDAMVYGMDCFLAVYPLQVWNTALARALQPSTGSRPLDLGLAKKSASCPLQSATDDSTTVSFDQDPLVVGASIRESVMNPPRTSGLATCVATAIVGAMSWLGLADVASAQPATPATLVFSGDAAPGMPVGSVITSLSEQCLSPNGQWAVVRANVSVPGQGGMVVVWGISLASGTPEVTVALQTGTLLDGSPSGFTFSNLPGAAVVNDTGHIFAGVSLCNAGCTQTVNGMAFFHASGSLKQMVAYEGQPAWDIDPPATFGGFATLEPRMSNLGQFQFSAYAGSRAGIWAGNSQFLWKVVAAGDTYPGIGTVTSVHSGSSCVLRFGSAVVECDVNFQRSILAWRDSTDLVPELIVGPGLNGVVRLVGSGLYGATYDPERDNVFVTAGVERDTRSGPRGGVEEFELGSALATPLGESDPQGYCCGWPTPLSTNRFTAFWRQPCCEGQLWYGSAENGDVHEILHPHDPVAGAPGHIVSSGQVYPVERYALNSSGRLAVVSYIHPPSGADYLAVLMHEFNSTDSSLWAATSAGTVIEVRPGIFKTVSSVNAPYSRDSGGDDGRPRWWSDLNTALIRVGFTDNSSAVMLARFCTGAPSIPPGGQPVDTAAALGDFATFRVQASIEGGASWQWRRRIRVGDVLTAVPMSDTGRVFGTNTPTLSISSVEADDAGRYDCVITTGCGSVTTSIVELTIGTCAADFDGNGAREVPDIFAYLSAWFAQDPRADIDGVPGITVPDIFAYLSLWFAGCP